METQQIIQAKAQEFIDFLSALPAAHSEVAAVDRLQLGTLLGRAVCAFQVEAADTLIQRRESQELAHGLQKLERLKGIEAEVGLARGESPYMGTVFTHTARALCSVLPNALAALKAGRLSEYHARVVSEETAHLSAEHRLALDAAIAHRYGKTSTGQLRKLIEGHAYRLDRVAAEKKAVAKVRRRNVCLNEGSDGMVFITAELPAHQGLAVMNALSQATKDRIAAAMQDAATQDDPDGEAARLAQDTTKADVFVERLTGQSNAEDVPAEVVVVIHDTTLFGDDELPAWIPGHGMIPVNILKQWLKDSEAKKLLRRLYTRPEDGQLVAMESRARTFPAGLAKMLRIRDDICATPWCNNPIQASDHREAWAKGGKTSWANGTGLCSRCNQRKENRDWTYKGTPDQLIVVTPTRHEYRVDTFPPITEIGLWAGSPPTFIDGPVDIAQTGHRNIIWNVAA